MAEEEITQRSQMGTASDSPRAPEMFPTMYVISVLDTFFSHDVWQLVSKKLA